MRSGDKYTTAQGFTAIKDGIKKPAAPAPAAAESGVRTAQRLPPWLRAPLSVGRNSRRSGRSCANIA
jgi:hypothetical protein